MGTSAAERQLLDWHLANLEYANAGHVDSLSLGKWDQDDPFEMSGDHVLLPGGNSRLVAAMAKGVPIFYETAVREVCAHTHLPRYADLGSAPAPPPPTPPRPIPLLRAAYGPPPRIFHPAFTLHSG